MHKIYVKSFKIIYSISIGFFEYIVVFKSIKELFFKYSNDEKLKY